ncbi:MBG domain-containing protein [Bowmanella pacifica]|uniref:Filamentous haemagglutinin FhaB/tRNA nuclease CdiA-like TPS domain-containing protein n=2 Tax=Bowmanella TaxID=366580 RepID=A0A917YRD2_9ALTE|nr:MBG domain-containing protein [Bowmanella pacifica]GGO64552.1 hypothetical protein GCM10010982_04260 [Bowmanella pacifica]
MYQFPQNPVSSSVQPANPVRRSLLAKAVQLALSSTLLVPAISLANPEGANVLHGDIQIEVDGNKMRIDQLSQLGIVNWDSFSIGESEQLDIQQLGLDSALLNRVTGADPSELLGRLSANGRVYVVNPNGVLVGEGAHINTAEFIASTLDIADADFLSAGVNTFSGDSNAPVINLGSITADSGDVILIAQVVENAGHIKAAQGTGALAAGNKVLYRPEAEQKIFIESGLAQTHHSGVTNQGWIEAAEAELKAAGGSVYELAINQSGIIRATGVTEQQGRVILTADAGSILHSGEISAHRHDGHGGEVYIGGGYQGKDSNLANASTVQVTETASIDVAAQSSQGNGGTAIVWADQQTDFFGQIFGQGGATQGDGAFAEVSGKHTLNYWGQAFLNATNGRVGTLLLDPDKAVISTATDDQSNGIFNNLVLETNLGNANVIVNSSGWGDGMNSFGDIEVNAPVSWSSANTLTLQANGAILINADITASAGNLDFQAGFHDMMPGNAITLNAANSISAQTLSLGQNADAVLPGMNPLPPNSRQLRAIDLAGRLSLATLDIKVENLGIDRVDITHSQNAIQTLTSSVTTGDITNGLTLINGNHPLLVSGQFNTGYNADLTIHTGGDLTLNSGTLLSSTNNGNIILASSSGSFTNQAGATALQPGSSGRFLVYSDDPANMTPGGLIAKPVYDKHINTDTPNSISASGNRFLYSLAPVLTLTADDLTRGQGSANPALTFSLSGLVGGDLISDAFSGAPALTTSADASSPIGSYSININQGSLVLSDYNYGLNLVDGLLNVTGDKILFITADDINRFFGDPNPDFTATYSGFQGTDNASLLDGFSINFSTAATSQSDVGTYDIIPSGAATVSDYSITYQNGTLTINPRLLTIRADNYQIDFLDDAPTYTASFNGLANFHTPAHFGGLVFTPPSITGAGSYQIGVHGVTDPNYSINFLPGTLTVNPRTIQAHIANASKVYGQTNPAFSISFSNLAGHHHSIIDTSGLTFSTAASRYSDIGKYRIYAHGISDSNFIINYQTGNLQVLPASLVIQGDWINRTYGDPNPALTYSVNGLLGTDTLSDAVTNFSISTLADIYSDVGAYGINLEGQSTGNYQVQFIDGRLNIQHAILNQVLIADANRVFGDSNPVFSMQVDGLKNGDTLADLNFELFSNANPGSSVGTYTIHARFINDGNYVVSPLAVNPGTLTIQPRPLTITANDISREYGLANPEFSASFDGLAPFHSAADIQGLTFWTPANISSHVMDYGLNLNVGFNPNYAITLQSGTLSVTPAPIYFETFNTQTYYGDNPNAVAVANYKSGLRNGDSYASLGIQVDAGGAINAGVHPVNISLSNANYRVAAHNGTIEILPRPITLSIMGRSRMYGDAFSQPLLVTTGGYGLVDPQDEVFAFTNLPSIDADVDTYLVGAELINPNYSLLHVDQGIVTVTPRIIAIKPVNAGHTYGDVFSGTDYLVTGAFGLAPFHQIDDIVADSHYIQFTRGVHHGFTYAYERIGEGEGADFLQSLLDASPTFGQQITPGGYQVKALFTDTALRNYHIISAPGALSVVPRPVTVNVQDAEGIRNQFINAVLASVDNLAPQDVGLSAFSLFPDLRFELLPFDAEPKTQKAIEVVDVPLAPALTDEEFLARYQPAQSQPTDTQQDSGLPQNGPVTVDTPDTDSTVIPIEIKVDDPEGSVITITPLDEISVSTTQIVTIYDGNTTTHDREAQQDSRLTTETLTIRPIFMANDNYVVTAVNLGTMTIHPDPKEVAAAKEEQRLEALHNLLYDPSYTSGDLTIHTNMALGFTRETIPVAIDALDWIINMQREQGSNMLWELIKSKMPIRDQNRGYRHTLELFIADLHINPDTQAFMTQIMKDYAHAMMRGDIQASTPAQQLYKAKLESYMGAAKEGFARKIEKNIEAYKNRNSPASRELFERNQLLKDNRAQLDTTLSQLQSTLEDLEALKDSDGNILDAAAQSLLQARADLLSQALAELEAKHQQIKSPEAIQARLTAIQALGGGINMADTLLGGDIPYKDIVNDSLTEMAEESISLIASNSVAQASSTGAIIAANAGLLASSTNLIISQSANEALKVAAQGSLEFLEEVGEEVVEKAVKKGVKTLVKKGASKVLSKIFIHATRESIKGGASLLSTHAGALSGAMNGIGFGLSVGISRAIIIAELADGEAFANQLTENASSRNLNLVADKMEGYQATANENTAVQIDNTLFKLGFAAMMSGQPPAELSSGYNII